MVISIDQKAESPLYLQIRNQIVAGIARGELSCGDSLPSVRQLASDLGINLHTVNKAYAVLRDEGYLIVRGRRGAFVADAAGADARMRQDGEGARMAEDLFRLALEHRARGGSPDEFIEIACEQAARAFGK